jgi:acyl-CoA thioesterase-2
MEAGRLMEVCPGDRPMRWELRLVAHLLTVSGAVQGGAAFGAALDALEAATDRPLILASAQFVRHAGPEGVLTFDVEVVASGPRTTQARVIARVGGEAVLAVHAGLGSRPVRFEGTWSPRPKVSGPEHGRPVPVPTRGGDLGSRLDVRLMVGRTDDELDGNEGSGRWIAWCRRLDSGGFVRPAELAVLADLSMLGLSSAVGRRLTGNSVDNSIRIADVDESGWILLDVGVDAIHNGYAHVNARLWSESGALLATANQSLIVREPGAAGRAVRSSRRIVGLPPAES